MAKSGFGNSPVAMSGTKRLHPGADAGARLAAFLVADEGETTSPASAARRLVEGPERFDGGRDPGLEVGGAAAPDFAIDDRGAEGILAVRSRPALAPAADMDDIGMADQEEALAVAPALAHAPHVWPAGQEVADGHAGHADGGQRLGEQRHEIRLVAGDAVAADCLTEGRDGTVAVDGSWRQDEIVPRRDRLRLEGSLHGEISVRHPDDPI